MTEKVFEAFTRLDASDVNAYLVNRPLQNAVINGAFDIWQRGTSFANPSNTTTFTADRFFHYREGLVTGMTTSRQEASLTGFRYCARIQRASGNTSTQPLNLLYNTTETSQAVALTGKTVTFSFYARAGTNYLGTLTSALVSGTGVDQNPFSFTGGTTVISESQSLSASWERFVLTGVMPSNSTEFYLRFAYTPTGTAGNNDYFEITGIQLEEGSVANPFRRNANSIQGELAACQRYLPAVLGSGGSMNGYSTSTTNSVVFFNFPVTARVRPTGITVSDLSHFQLLNSTLGAGTPTAITFDSFNTGISGSGIQVTTSSGSPTIAAGQGAYARIINSAGSILFTGCEL